MFLDFDGLLGWRYDGESPDNLSNLWWKREESAGGSFHSRVGDRLLKLSTCHESLICCSLASGSLHCRSGELD